MKLLSWLFFIALFCHNNCDYSDLRSSEVNTFRCGVEDNPTLLPSIKDIFQLPTNILIGLPGIALSSTINLICSAVLPGDAVIPPVSLNIEEMYLQLHTGYDIENFPLLRAEELAKSPNFDTEKKVVVFVPGWLSGTSSSISLILTKAYICRNDTNVVVLDTAMYTRTEYTKSAYNTAESGKFLAKSLIDLIKVVPLENIHLIGHSLGAHIVGAAGRYFQENSGIQLPYITGIDPAKPCFNGGDTLPGIYSGNAAFVDIFHSNPGGLGQAQSLGDVDYYAGGLLAIQPGCIGHICSHIRALQYYAETVYPNNERDFLATPCASLTHLCEESCYGEEQPMGYAVSHDLRGIYFSEVNAEEPYGPNASYDFQSSISACGASENLFREFP